MTRTYHLTHNKKPPTVELLRSQTAGGFLCPSWERTVTCSPYQESPSRSSQRSVLPRSPHVTSRGMSIGQRLMRYRRHMPVEQNATSAMPNESASVAKCWNLPA